MGLYDRPYYREDERGSWLSGRSMTVNLILLNVAVYVAQLLFGLGLTDALSLHDDLLYKPWQFYQLVTYGFVHDPEMIGHVVFNMIVLWFFGTEVEGVYGRAEMLRIYLATIVLAGLVWVGIEMSNDQPQMLLGASGGVMGMMMLFVLNFPRRVVYIWGILPLPAWALGALYVVLDVMGVMSPGDNKVANVAHLAGAGFGFIYFRGGMNLGRYVPSRLSGNMFRWRPKLRIHDPQDDARQLSEQVDEILAKITKQGEASLTKKERRTLEEASRRYQRPRH